MIIVDGSNHVLGRISSIVAKKVLSGEQVFLINAEKIVVIGKKDVVMKKFVTRQGLTTKGNQRRNPKFPRTPHAIVKRTIQGMLPYPRKRGIEALKKFRAFTGVPRELEGKELIVFEKALNKSDHSFLTVGEISTNLGVKWQQ